MVRRKRERERERERERHRKSKYHGDFTLTRERKEAKGKSSVWPVSAIGSGVSFFFPGTLFFSKEAHHVWPFD